MNIERAKRKVRFVPNRSPTQPDTGIHTARLREYPRTTHVVVATDALNAELIETSETFTAVRSTMSINSAITKTVATIHL